MSTTRLPASYQAMQRIESHLKQMPFINLVKLSPIPDADRSTPEDFIIALADWLASYRAVVRLQSDEFTRTAAKLCRLKDQRNTIREFFGTVTLLESDDR